MVNLRDGIWNPEPMLSPEDETILRKLHDMLQSTADDLKLLSGELSKYHEPGVQVKTLPMPLDEEFNEKIHIEEIVNAKFHGYKIVDSKPPSPNIVLNESNKAFKANSNKSYTKKFVDTSVQVNYMPTLKKPTLRRNLGISRTKIVQIDEKSKKENETQSTSNNNTFHKKNSPAVIYNEFSYKYVEPKMQSLQRPLQVQDMPSINIRSELTKQKVLQLDITPDSPKMSNNPSLPSNALVITMQHKPAPTIQFDKSITFNPNRHSSTAPDQPNIRKVSKMSTCESSESNNISSDSQQQRIQRHYKQTSQKTDYAANFKSKSVNRKELKRTTTNLEEWKKKLNAVYGRPKQTSTFRTKKSPKTSHKSSGTQSKLSKVMNNSEYIPYSKLTLGGVSVSDIEREICHIPNRQDIIISPILDKILSSRENSFHNESPRRKSPKVLTTSDENLLQEVIDIEYQVTQTLSSKVKNTNKPAGNNLKDSKENKDSDSYADDFEDEKSEGQQSQSNKSQPAYVEASYSNSLNEEEIVNNSDENAHDKTYTKTTNLSLKNAVDIFEFVHSIDTQETGTQSCASKKISPKETQTSPRNEQTNIRPFHNDLWPSVDSKNEVERMFNLEKDFIKKLILEEYGDILDKDLNKPSTSKSVKSELNAAASAKNTQTSPAHVKSVMTSPTRTKTRTTSPFSLSVTVNQQTSPMVVVSKEEEIKVEIGDDDELGISVNLSSPRFSLRLPQSSKEVLSNFEASYKTELAKKNHLRKSSSSSLNEDYSSSDISSVGQIGKNFKRKIRKSRIPSISELSFSSSLSGCSSARSGVILPLKSEGEASVGDTIRKKSSKNNRSEGEASMGQTISKKSNKNSRSEGEMSLGYN